METYEIYRPRLFGIAYRMLGSAMAAEDILQDAYLRVRSIPDEDMRSPQAFLSRVVTRLCLDELKTVRAKRETYVGEWLPEPVVTTESPFERAIERESLSMAFLLLLETLSPLERAVFVLREVFDYDYAEIAETLGKSEPACRQLLSRARQHVSQHRARFESDPQVHQALLESFLAAVGSGDLDGLMHLLHEDVVNLSDGGGKASAAIHPIKGANYVARFVLGMARQMRDGMFFEVANLNGSGGIIIREGTEVFSVVLFDVIGGQIGKIHMIRNPDKLALRRLSADGI
jgi:RNA polymerase sigma-70 factor (ECF subfamily)